MTNRKTERNPAIPGVERRLSHSTAPNYIAFLMTKQSSTFKNTVMNSQKTGLYVAALIFAILALAHAVRLWTQAKSSSRLT